MKTKVVVVILCVLAVLGGIVFWMGPWSQRPPEPATTPTATATPKTGTLTVEQVVFLARAGEFSQGEPVMVSGKLISTEISGLSWYAVLGPSKEGPYVIVWIGVSQFRDIMSVFPNVPVVELIVKGYYYGFQTVENYYGPLLKYTERIK